MAYFVPNSVRGHLKLTAACTRRPVPVVDMGGDFPNTADFGSPRGTTVDDAKTTRGVTQEWDVEEEDEGFATMSQLQHQQPTFPAEEELSLGRSRPGKIINDHVHGHMGAHAFFTFRPTYGAQSLVT